MRTVPLGDTGINVSALCLGAMYFGTKNDRATSYQLLDQYTDAGGTFIDTANIYAHWVEGFAGGESETLLGGWMRERHNRDQVFLASKVGFEYIGVSRGLSVREIEVECEKSLRRLQTDVIDLYYAHLDYRDSPLEETLEAFQRLVTAGKVRFVGASNYRAWRLEEARQISHMRGWSAYCCVQQRYTYLRPNPDSDFGAQLVANDDLLDYCRARPVTLLAYSALLGGAFTRMDRPLPDAYVSADSDARLAALQSVADELGATTNQVILAWMLHSDPFVLPLIAASTDEQLDENLAALDLHLTNDQIWRLNSASSEV